MDLPINSMVIFHSFLYVYQRVCSNIPWPNDLKVTTSVEFAPGTWPSRRGIHGDLRVASRWRHSVHGVHVTRAPRSGVKSCGLTIIPVTSGHNYSGKPNLPSAKRLHNYGKSPFWISTGPFSIAMLNYQRVIHPNVTSYIIYPHNLIYIYIPSSPSWLQPPFRVLKWLLVVNNSISPHIS